MKTSVWKVVGAGLLGALLLACGRSAPSQPAPLPPGERMHLFLLIGQSNMEGVPKPAEQDLVENERVMVLGFGDCGGRRYNEWAVAKAPLHRCGGGLGPGDEFAKVVAGAWPKARLGLVPTAIAGVDIDLFRKGVVSKRRGEFQIPPDNQRAGAYDMVVERARLAQRDGDFRAILFHQGESDNGDPAWVGKVAGLVADLRADLNLSERVPFVAGELLRTGCCAAHNSLVNELPAAIPNAHVVKSEGLAGMDAYHFDLEGQRELGARYASEVLGLIEWPK